MIIDNSCVDVLMFCEQVVLYELEMFGMYCYFLV